MENYHSDCLSLPQQVYKNAVDIEYLKRIHPEYGFWVEKTTIFMNGPKATWSFNEDLKLWALIISNTHINEDTIINLVPQDETVLSDKFITSYYNIKVINSINGGFIVYATEPPLIDLKCKIYFNSNITKKEE